MRRLLLATHNPHKTREFSEMLGEGFVIRDLSHETAAPVIAEIGSTFEENAILKARGIATQIPGLTVADDSGLEVDALNGAPGVYSARYAGPKAIDAENVAKLLRELRAIDRGRPFTARFRCVLALAQGSNVLETFEGAVEGTIVDPARGKSGFGYDPVFQPIGFNLTLAELQPAEKNRISHRAVAIRLLREALSR